MATNFAEREKRFRKLYGTEAKELVVCTSETRLMDPIEIPKTSWPITMDSLTSSEIRCMRGLVSNLSVPYEISYLFTRSAGSIKDDSMQRKLSFNINPKTSDQEMRERWFFDGSKRIDVTVIDKMNE
jgi:hypothetical protein